MENPHAPRSDPHRDISHFLRSREQDHALALYTAEEVAAAEGTDMKAASEAADAAVAATSATAAEAAAATDPLQAPTASAEDSSTSSTTSSTLLLRCQVKNFLINYLKYNSPMVMQDTIITIENFLI